MQTTCQTVRRGCEIGTGDATAPRINVHSTQRNKRAKGLCAVRKHDSDENLPMAVCSTQLHSPLQTAATVHDECSSQPRDFNITHESAARGQWSVVRNACQGRDSQYCKSGCRQDTVDCSNRRDLPKCAMKSALYDHNSTALVQVDKQIFTICRGKGMKAAGPRVHQS